MSSNACLTHYSLVAAARCPFFAEYFERNPGSSSAVSIPGSDPRVLRVVIEYIYTDKITEAALGVLGKEVSYSYEAATSDIVSSNLSLRSSRRCSPLPPTCPSPA